MVQHIQLVTASSMKDPVRVQKLSVWIAMVREYDNNYIVQISDSLADPVDCEEGAVRISDGLIENEGRLEVCVNGVWSSVCDAGWDKTDAHVVCQQLGFSELGTYSTCYVVDIQLSLFYRTRSVLWYSIWQVNWTNSLF